MCPFVLYIYTHIYTYIDNRHVIENVTGKPQFVYRLAKTHRMPYLHWSFVAKEPYN